ncbi:MAG: hypothetical protein LBO66_15045 [Deltaproteobacteria bacterium]|jgi:hypothetical protein|nr:hypothetical protein [Deltaproteobacteria bacterium]
MEKILFAKGLVLDTFNGLGINYHEKTPLPQPLEKAEWERRLARHRAFLEPKKAGEGAYVLVSAPAAEKTRVEDILPKAVDLPMRWFNVQRRVVEALVDLGNKNFFGDALPTAPIYFGCANLAALLGAPYKLAESSIWFDLDPPIKDLAALPPLSLQRDSLIYKAIELTTKSLAALSPGNFVLGMTDIGSNLDALFSLTPREKALVAMKKNPRAIEKLLWEITERFLEFYAENYAWISAGQDIVSSLNQLCCPGRYYKLMSESSIMVSPALFRDLVLPTLRRQAEFLDWVVFEIDGIRGDSFLSEIVKADFCSAVEWSPRTRENRFGEIKPDFLGKESLRVCRKILESDKKLVLSGIGAEDALSLLREVPADGLFLGVEAQSGAEALAFLKKAEKWMSF